VLAVFPFCLKDFELLRENLQWIKKLGQVENHDALLVSDAGVPWTDCCELLEIANKTFRTAKLISTKDSFQGWTQGAVVLFSAAAEWCEKEHRDFFWSEPDCWALKPSWLNELEDAYGKCGRPFMGPIIKSEQPQFPSFFMEGCAVYPWNAWSLMKGCIKETEAWVTSCANIVVPQAVNTPLVIQWWGQPDMTMKFVDVRTADSKPNEISLANLRAVGVVFHRVKDLSLKQVLMRKYFPTEPDYSRPPAFVQMGRVGDLILMLPAWKAWADRSGYKTIVVTTKEFGTVLEGCSYITPVLTRYSWYDVGIAKRWAIAQYGNVICTQLHGVGIEHKPDDLPSYSFSMWAKAGLLEEYYTLGGPVFDQRNAQREQLLIKQHINPNKRNILVKFDGWTSPFDYVNQVRSVLNEWKEEFHFVELDKVHAHRVFDLLGLFEKAVALISVDTMAIHLAPATDIPYIAFTRGDGQSRSMPKGNCVLEIHYHDTPKNLHAIDLQLQLWHAQCGAVKAAS